MPSKARSKSVAASELGKGSSTCSTQPGLNIMTKYQINILIVVKKYIYP